MMQRLVAQDGSVYATVPVVAGPHAWVIGDYEFSTVLVKTVDDKKAGHYSMIDVRSGRRVAHVECRAPKTKPHAAMFACSAMIDRLRERKGDAEVIHALKHAPELPK